MKSDIGTKMMHYADEDPALRVRMLHSIVPQDPRLEWKFKPLISELGP